MAQRALIEKPQPLYPGAAIMMMRFRRPGEIGDVRVQEYHAEAFLVGQYTPGCIQCSDGDTPKIVPNIHQWTKTFDDACAVFDRYCDAVRTAGWTEIEDDKEGA
jgi:hypothetical protein